ncbi:glucokinase [Paenibacillaceae bacterium GAS479]|nr:glucokinase [Paenibacillaceae bacterium GAS479]
MANIVIALDVGGTFIKTCIVENGVPLAWSQEVFPALADQDEGTILAQFMHILKSRYQLYTSQVAGNGLNYHWQIGFAFPGPFDYEQGICYVQGLGKFESLYGVNIREALYERLQKEEAEWAKQLQQAEIRFQNDARLFALGVSLDFPRDRFIALTLGTGLGSAFIDQAQISGHVQGIPESGWLYDQPYRGERIDDVFSRRGLLQLAEDLGALHSGMDVKELAESARLGNVPAREVFREFGKRLADMLAPYIELYRPTLIVFGGQISKSYDLFGKALQDGINSPTIVIHTSENMLEHTFKGISRLFEK